LLKLPVRQYRKHHQSCRYSTKTVIKGSGTTIQKLTKPLEQQHRNCHQSHRNNNTETLTKAAGNTTQNQSPKPPTNNTETVIKAARKTTNKRSRKPLAQQYRNHHQSCRNNTETVAKATRKTK